MVYFESYESFPPTDHFAGGHYPDTLISVPDVLRKSVTSFEAIILKGDTH